MINGAACSGNLKIFELILENMKEKYSVFLRDAVIEATKVGNIEIVKRVLDDKNYQLSEASFVDAICNSIEYGSDELIDYFIEQKKHLPLITEIISSACKAQNVKSISIDYTKPFLKAVFFIETKVDLDYEEFFSNFKKIALTNHRVIILLINETKIEKKID